MSSSDTVNSNVWTSSPLNKNAASSSGSAMTGGRGSVGSVSSLVVGVDVVGDSSESSDEPEAQAITPARPRTMNVDAKYFIGSVWLRNACFASVSSRLGAVEVLFLRHHVATGSLGKRVGASLGPDAPDIHASWVRSSLACSGVLGANKVPLCPLKGPWVRRR